MVLVHNSIYAKSSPCYHPSICLAITQVDLSKMVAVRIMQFSPCSSPILP